MLQKPRTSGPSLAALASLSLTLPSSFSYIIRLLNFAIPLSHHQNFAPALHSFLLDSFLSIFPLQDVSKLPLGIRLNSLSPDTQCPACVPHATLLSQLWHSITPYCMCFFNHPACCRDISSMRTGPFCLIHKVLCLAEYPPPRRALAHM